MRTVDSAYPSGIYLGEGGSPMAGTAAASATTTEERNTVGRPERAVEAIGHEGVVARSLVYLAVDDAGLVAAIRDGDEVAVVALASRYRPALLRQARRRRLDDDAVEDAVAAVIEHVVRHLARRDAEIPRSVPAYVHRAMANHLESVARRDRRRDRAHLAAASDAGDFDLRVVLSACSEATARAARGLDSVEPPVSAVLRRLGTLLDEGLTDDERRLLLWERERVPKTLIAEWVGATHGATKQRIRRLRARLVEAARRYATTLGEAERDELRRFLDPTEPPPPSRRSE